MPARLHVLDIVVVEVGDLVRRGPALIDAEVELLQPQLTGDRPACGHECLVIAHQTRKGKAMRKRWNGGGKQGQEQEW